jgi:hypothetical protein
MPYNRRAYMYVDKEALESEQVDVLNFESSSESTLYS